MSDRITFGHPLYGAELRLARARQLIGTLHRQYQRWANLHEEPEIAQRFDRDRGVLNIQPLIHRESVIRVPRMSLTVGEIAYNVRSALDFLVYSIARANNNGVEVDGTQFPMEDVESRYWGRWSGTDDTTGRRIARYLDKIPKTVADDLAHYQPFANCRWAELLRDISNRDKHRHLSTLTTSTKLVPDEPIRRVIDPVKNAQSFHLKGQIEVGVFLPTGEDVIDAAHLIQGEARALIRSYAGRFKIPPPGFI
jgi:hypothetical protein